nr:polyadenylate-binding protein 6-like [Ipomoea batatas]
MAVLPTLWLRYTLYVGDLHPETTEADLEAVFSMIGPLDSFGIRRDVVSGKSLCYGFVNFFCISHGNKSFHFSKYVSIFKKKEERMMDLFNEQKFTNVYVKNIGYNMTEELLREMFSVYGNINSAVIMRDEEGNSRGFGFVNFDSDEDARKAVEALNGQVIGSKKLYVGRAQKKAERERLLRIIRYHTHEGMC